MIPPTFHYKTEYPAFLSFSDFPSGFGYITATLKQAGHEVFGLNPNNITGYFNAKAMLVDVITKKINECKPELIGLGGLCTDYAFLRDAIEIIRGVNPKIPIVLGGQIVSNDAEDIFNILKPDYAVKGEGEWAMTRLADGMDGKKIIDSLPLNLDDMPIPDYQPFGVQDMLDNYSMATRLLYRYSRPDARPFNIVASRGCPFSCSFCIHGHRSTPYRARAIESVMEEIRVTYEKYHYNVLIILDELFAVNKKRMVDFCAGVMEGKKKYGWDFDWMMQTHASAKLDAESLSMAKEAGLFFFSYGLESASPTVLKSMNKKIEIEQVIEAQELARQAKVGFGGNLIFGDPAETMETIAESLAFWFTHCKDNFVFLATLMPYPGSAVFDKFFGKLTLEQKKHYYENIDQGVVNMTTIPDREYTEFLKLFKFLESSWLFEKDAKGTVERDSQFDKYLTAKGGAYYNITSRCSYCGDEIHYRELFAHDVQEMQIGTGCPSCNRKIKVIAG